MNKQNTKFNTAFVIPFKSWLLVKAVQELQIFRHWRNSSKAKKTKTHTPKQSSTECRFAEWSTTIPFTLFVRIIYQLLVSLFTAVVIHGDQFSIYINSTAFINRQPWQFQKLRRAFSKEVKKKRLKANWIGTPVGELMFTENCSVVKL